MGALLILGGLSVAALVALAVPWIGVLAAYLVGILNPQSIWWWQLEGTRLVLLVTVPTLIGTAIAGLRGRLRLDALRSWPVVWLLVMLGCGALSYLFGPYSFSDPTLGIASAGFVLETHFKITLMVIAAVSVSCAPNRLESMAWMFIVVGAYLTWWINDRYLFGGAFGRIGGPSSPSGLGGTYEDENLFATLFVALVPFLWYFGWLTRRKWVRGVLWTIIPFAWHAVFLTGSRGGLLALVATLLLMVVRFKRRFLALGVAVAFVIAFVLQAGNTMWERSGTIDDYQDDSSAVGRLEAWDAAMRMMLAHPFTGVGPGAFIRAFPGYSEAVPRAAHNTLFQFGAEYGPVAALAFVSLIVSSLWALRRNGKRLASQGNETGSLYLLNEAILTAMLGVTVCAMFLTLQLFELLYFLVFLTIAVVATSRPTKSTVAAARTGPTAGRDPVRLTQSGADARLRSN
jgi:probable O-glycosylation ligase (exosortase A-associated)